MSDPIAELLQTSWAAHQAGHLHVAAQGYAAVLQVAPQTAEAWHLAGLAAHQAGNTPHGIMCLERAIALTENPEFLNNLAALHQAQGAPARAAALAERALSLDPDFAAAHFRRGVALGALGHSEAALEHLNLALQASFAPEATLLEIGNLLQAAGELALAIRAWEWSLDLNPRQPNIYYNLSRLVSAGDYEFSPEQVWQIQEILRVNQAIPSLREDSATLHFALGCFFDRAGDYRRAHQHFENGNRLIAHAATRGGSEIVAEAPGLTAAEESDPVIAWYQRVARDMAPRATPYPAQREMDSGAQPIFVVGLPRSGTTLTAHLLARHPEVGGVGEFGTLSELLSPALERSTNPRSLAHSAAGLWSELSQEYLRRLRQHWQQPGRSSELATAPRFVDKLPDNFRWLGFLPWMFPASPVIYCRRDPRDLALSNFQTLFESRSLRIETAQWQRIAAAIRNHYRLWRFWEAALGSRVISVFYEDLVRQPAAETRRLIRSVGLVWTEACLEESADSQPVLTASAPQVRKPIYQSSVGRWRNYQDHLAPLWESLADEIDEYEAARAALANLDSPAPLDS